jgi:hypothetical protein
MTETTTAERTATDQTRAEFTAALRELADFIDAHPDLPLPYSAKLQVHLDGTDEQDRADVDRIAGILDVQPQSSPRGHYRAERDFGCRVEYAAAAIPAQVMRRHAALMSYDSVVTP